MENWWRLITSVKYEYAEVCEILRECARSVNVSFEAEHTARWKMLECLHSRDLDNFSLPPSFSRYSFIHSVLVFLLRLTLEKKEKREKGKLKNTSRDIREIVFHELKIFTISRLSLIKEKFADLMEKILQRREILFSSIFRNTCISDIDLFLSYFLIY